MAKSIDIIERNSPLMTDYKDLSHRSNKYPYSLDRHRGFTLKPLIPIVLIPETNETLLQSTSVLKKIYSYQLEVTIFSEKRLRIENIKNKIFDSIDNYIALKNDWDGYGAIPIDVEVAQQARKFIQGISDELFLFFDDGYPNTHGTMSFEWKKENKDFFIEIGNKKISYYFLENGIVKSKGDKIDISRYEFLKVYNLLNGYSN